jgi:hypothetical protein
MFRANRGKNPEDILKEEFLQERAAVLGRAGEKVSAALETLCEIERVIQERLVYFNEIVEACKSQHIDNRIISLRQQIIKEINIEVGRFNRAREYAKLRYYYLVVTREAMGMHRHHWIEDAYKIPPRKKYFRDE